MKLSLILVLLILLVPVCQAQPVMSYGHLVLPIRTDECLRIAPRAYDREGYRLGNSGDSFMFGVHDIYKALIVCSAAPDGMTWVTFVVTANAPSPDVPGREREVLQHRFDEMARWHERDRDRR